MGGLKTREIWFKEKVELSLVEKDVSLKLS